jgi:sugar phosphate isomerase/epimerase
VTVVIDAMHLFRSNGTLEALRLVPPQQIAYAQLCDVPLHPRHDDYLKEACFERRIPGEGGLPLAEFCAALPRDIVIGIEVPMLAVAQQPDGLSTAVSRAVAAARRLLA